ncbi:alpha/beta fold hydrolase [Amycolatopsis jejuensis]|uniref:alpha/beta fold hydrolase n=1 Tax=Amycolatopsis jejuensis TaxID=330084 RepID=UPI0005255945|nr:alpha/beta fold hydrolase [Amycolatopsis jejuensis]
MVVRKLVTLVVVVMASVVVVVQPAAAEVSWTPCTKLAASWPKSAGTSAECTTVTVPVDYARPDGRTVAIAVDRIPASDRAHRRGVLVLNPGGPGGTGVSMPERIRQSRLAELGKYYDLVGFDPRGTGYSAQISCQAMGGGPEPKPGQSAKDQTVARILWRADQFGECEAKDPEFARTLSADTIARDVDRIRQALGEEKISYYGISWGTGLGAAYRSRFDEHVDKMALDSALPATMDLDRFEWSQSEAGDANVRRFADWMAARDAVLHLGRTGDAVLDTVRAIRDEADAHPRQIVEHDTPVTLNGAWVMNQLYARSPDWGTAASALAALHAGKDPVVEPSKAPATVFGWDEKRPLALNRYVQHAVNCNDSTGTRDMDEMWRKLSALKADYPFGALGEPVYMGSCIKWPYAGANPALRPGRSPLQLIGHLYETVTPYRDTLNMQHHIGGNILTVRDDVHGSLAQLPCASKVVKFFETGVPSTDTCDGQPSQEPKPTP